MDRHRSLASVVAWAVLLVAITAGGVVWLNAAGGDYRTLSPPILVIAYSPAVAALLVASVQRGPLGARALLAQLTRWRAGAGWYAVALLGPFALVLVAAGVAALAGAAPTAWIAVPSGTAALALAGPVVAGMLGEELGWRGFAQHRLQRYGGALVAAVAIGSLWSLWHLWPLATPAGQADASAATVAQTSIRLISTSVVYAWLYDGTRGALPVVLVAHGAHDLAVSLIAPDVLETAPGAWAIAVLYAVAAAAVVATTRARTLTPRSRSRTPRSRGLPPSAGGRVGA